MSQRTGIINQIRAFLLERGVAVRQGLRFLRAELPGILAGPSDVLSPRMVRIIEDLAGDWHRLDERIEDLSKEIEAIARQDSSCERLMSVAEQQIAKDVGVFARASWNDGRNEILSFTDIDRSVSGACPSKEAIGDVQPTRSDSAGPSMACRVRTAISWQQAALVC